MSIPNASISLIGTSKYSPKSILSTTVRLRAVSYHRRRHRVRMITDTHHLLFDIHAIIMSPDQC